MPALAAAAIQCAGGEFSRGVGAGPAERAQAPGLGRIRLQQVPPAGAVRPVRGLGRDGMRGGRASGTVPVRRGTRESERDWHWRGTASSGLADATRRAMANLWSSRQQVKESSMAARREYIKPEISSVVLIPDEAVLGECKTSSGSGPIGDDDCVSNACLEQLS